MKKIAVNTIKTFLKEHKREDVYTKTFEVAGSSFDVTFHTNLSIAEKTTFINRVLSGCFDGLGNFRPEYVSPVLRATIIQMCTNIPALTLKNETSNEGVPALDLEAMNELYMVMNLDEVDDRGYRIMLNEMVQYCSQAIDWKKSRIVTSHDTDSAVRDLLVTLTEKVQDMDTDSLMQYAGNLSEATQGLGKGEILKGLLEARMKQAN